MFLSSFLLTTFLLQWWQQGGYPELLWGMLGIFFVTGLLCLIPGMTRRFALGLCASILGIALSFLSVAGTTHVSSPTTVDWYAHDQTVHIHGKIAEEPDRRPLVTKYTIAAHGIMPTGSGGWIPVTGRVLVNDYRGWPEYAEGEDVIASGKLSLPGEIEGFHYDRYLSIDAIYCVMTRGTLERTGRASPWRFSFPSATKRHFEGQIERLLPEPHASFAEGLLTGSRRGIADHLMQDFTATGLTHIVAISGYNITIVLTVILGLLFWLPLAWRIPPAIAAIVLFTIFVGASASVTRAAIMGIIGLLAMVLGRQRDARLAILWTLFLMLVWNPKHLWYDAGFQLSFAAVIGLSELSPFLTPLLRAIPSTLGLKEALTATMAAQIAATPLALLLFGNLSLVAPLANILVAPAIPLAMLLIAVSVCVSWLSFFLGQCIAYLGWACLQWIIVIAGSLARIPGSALHLEHVNLIVIIAYYVILTLIVIVANARRKKLSIAHR